MGNAQNRMLTKMEEVLDDDSLLDEDDDQEDDAKADEEMDEEEEVDDDDEIEVPPGYQEGDGAFPVIRVISNLSTTSLKEVSTRRENRRIRKPRRVASVEGRHSEAATFVIYSETSSEIKGGSYHGGSSSTASASIESITASDSASNTNWKLRAESVEDNVNVNRGSLGGQKSESRESIQAGCVFVQNPVLGVVFVVVSVVAVALVGIVVYTVYNKKTSIADAFRK